MEALSKESSGSGCGEWISTRRNILLLRSNLSPYIPIFGLEITEAATDASPLFGAVAGRKRTAQSEGRA